MADSVNRNDQVIRSQDVRKIRRNINVDRIVIRSRRREGDKFRSRSAMGRKTGMRYFRWKSIMIRDSVTGRLVDVADCLTYLASNIADA